MRQDAVKELLKKKQAGEKKIAAAKLEAFEMR
jgi:hypothetical protein